MGSSVTPQWESAEEVMQMVEKAKARVCVPLEERAPNEVDRLQKRIDEIQEACSHDFRLIAEPELTETLVGGVFRGLNAEASIGLPERMCMVLVCMKCSKKKGTSILKTCPRCLGAMKKGWCLGASSRVRYFGREYLYYAIVLSTCVNCTFTVASDEWDQ